MLPRWKRCVTNTDRALGEPLGQLYVARNFTPEAKMHAQQIVKNLIAALRDDLGTLSWMSDDARNRASTKLDSLVRKIGYPDTWRNNDALQVSRRSYYSNVVSVGEFEFRRNLDKIGKPIDRTEVGHVAADH